MLMTMQLKILYSIPLSTFCIASSHFATITCDNNNVFKNIINIDYKILLDRK